MNDAQLCFRIGAAMISFPLIGFLAYATIENLILSYKHAKFLDKVHGTTWRVKHEKIGIFLFIWITIAAIFMLGACIYSDATLEKHSVECKTEKSK